MNWSDVWERPSSRRHAASRLRTGEAEIESLRVQASVWRAYVEANRAADPAIQEQEIEELLRTRYPAISTP